MATAYCPEGHVSNPDLAGGDENRYEFRGQAWRSACSTVVAPAAPAERLRRRLDPAADHQARRAFVEAGTRRQRTAVEHLQLAETIQRGAFRRVRRRALAPGEVFEVALGVGHHQHAAVAAYPHRVHQAAVDAQRGGEAVEQVEGLAGRAIQHFDALGAQALGGCAVAAVGEVRSGARKRAERIEERNSERNLLLFRLESLLSWSEHLALDRCSDDEDDPDGARVAEDLDYLSLSRQRTQKGGGLRLDLDLPAADYDDLPLGPGLKLPEWDYRQQRLLSDHVLLQPMRPRGATSASLPAHLEKTALHLRRQFACLRDGRQRLRQQPQGDEIDLDAWLDFQVERRRGGSTQPGLFLEQRPRRRDLACLLLADLSMSTEAYLDDQRRVIDSIVDSLLLFGEALQALGDPFALYGFSSVRRQQVRWQVLKDFDEGYGGEVRGRVLALSPGYYTRMGAAIRRASQVLGGQPQKRRLLLLLSDGKPNDLDRYEGRYGIEDTRQAVIEARSQGLVPFCITIDKEAADYLPYLFGADGFALVERAGQLPERLLQLYRRLRR